MTQSDHAVDLAIIGGGVNGCGIARDAAGRGLRVYLCEAGDLAGGTSSASTKLIHGGLRYLEHYAFRLVREALIEREILLRNAPHIIWPMRFVLPHHKGLRPRWLLRLGLFIYDHLGGGGSLPRTSAVDLRNAPAGEPLQTVYRHAFVYSDCWVDDARLVILNAVDAAERGAIIRTRARCDTAKRQDGQWRLTVSRKDDTGAVTIETVTARALINAAGPWVGAVESAVTGNNAAAPVRLVKGSHIITGALFDHDAAYIFQNRDGRIVFAIPYQQGRYTLIGTTDRDFHGNPGEVSADEDEIAYLCEAVSAYFRVPVTPADVLHSYAGVRPLYDDGADAAQEATRDYVLALDDSAGAALLTIYGGKITTYRKLAEAALARLEGHLPTGAPWTANAPLPGGAFPAGSFDAQVAGLMRDHPFLEAATATRLVRAYGTRAGAFLNGHGDLGEILTGDLGTYELAYLVDKEFALTADDILMRRTKFGLAATDAERAAIARFVAQRIGQA
ncbi:MAG: glycerol-3-phosphate dehydrogenase [Salinarimonas sp.]